MSHEKVEAERSKHDFKHSCPKCKGIETVLNDTEEGDLTGQLVCLDCGTYFDLPGGLS